MADGSGARATRRRLLGATLLACAGVRPTAAATIAGPLHPWGDRPTPALAATDLDGRPRTLADFAGRVVLLNFWATYCAPCLAEMPALGRLATRLGPRGFVLVGVNHGEMPARVRRFLQQVPFGGATLLDRSMTQLARWGADALPTSVVLDRDGHARWLHVGELDWDAPGADAQIAMLL